MPALVATSESKGEFSLCATEDSVLYRDLQLHVKMVCPSCDRVFVSLSDPTLSKSSRITQKGMSLTRLTESSPVEHTQAKQNQPQSRRGESQTASQSARAQLMLQHASSQGSLRSSTSGGSGRRLPHFTHDTSNPFEQQHGRLSNGRTLGGVHDIDNYSALTASGQTGRVMCPRRGNLLIYITGLRYMF